MAIGTEILKVFHALYQSPFGILIVACIFGCVCQVLLALFIFDFPVNQDRQDGAQCDDTADDGDLT